MNKLVGPTTVITYLGIQIDSVALMVSLLVEKLARILELLDSWVEKHTCTKKELLSLIGLLSFACKVIKPGHIFLWRLIGLPTMASELHSEIVVDEGLY